MTATATALAIRAHGVDSDPSLRVHVLEKLSRKLAKLGGQIARATVRFEDVNGPRGGVDSLCRIKLVMNDMPSIVVEEIDAKPVTAFDTCVQRVTRAARRDLDRADRSAGSASSRSRHRRKRRSGPVETAASVRSAAGRRTSMPKRNAKKNIGRATVKLEASATGKPSRKSSRRSVNSAKSDDKLRLRETARTRSPSARSARAAARNR